MFRNTRNQLCATLITGLLAATASSARADIAFQEVSKSAGIVFSGETHGASWGDVNGDGYPDIYANNHHMKDSLYINNRNGTFKDIANTITKWNQSPKQDTHGGSFVDFDNDGDQDLFIATGTVTPNQFFVNNNGVLTEQAAAWGLTHDGWEAHLSSWFDVNGDGLLDFMIGINNGPDAVMERVGDQWIWNNAKFGFDCRSQRINQFIDLDGDGKLDLVCGVFTYPMVAYNYHTRPFTNMTSLMPVTKSVTDVAIGDFDGDLRNDVFMTRGTFQQSGATVTGNNVEAQLTTATKQFSFKTGGVLTVDIDWKQATTNRIKIGAQGWGPAVVPGAYHTRFTLDPGSIANQGIVTPYVGGTDGMVYIGFAPGTQTWTFVFSMGSVRWGVAYFRVSSTSAVSALKTAGIGGGDYAMSPRLLLNKAGGFIDATAASGLGAPISGIAAVAGDFDNDMDMDIYVVNRSSVRNEPNTLYENLGNGTFRAVPAAGGAQGPLGSNIFGAAGTGDQVVVADYDLDGYLDLFVVNGLNIVPLTRGGPDNLFHNLGSGNNWIELDLQGTISNRDAVGAKVYATVPGKTQLREQNGGYHRAAQNFKRIHFGLAHNAVVDLKVLWPSGGVDTYSNVAVNKVYRAVEGGGLVVVAGTP